MKKQNTTAGAEETKATANPSQNEAKEVQFQPLAPEVQEMITRLKQENESLKIQLKEQPLSLEDKIRFFQEKKAKIDKLAVLDSYAENLLKIGSEAQEASEEDEFFNEKFSVRVAKRSNNYNNNSDDILKISNPVLVVEVLGYALERINAKRTKLKAEIEA